mgnify:CR=1 FL=1
MKIALLGYGKMGKAIEQIALERGHEITAKINSRTPLESFDWSLVDVCIEFTQPQLALKHIAFCAQRQVPIVVGTTAWLSDLPAAKAHIESHDSALLHASNFSVGVNLFFEINKTLAALMSKHPKYEVSLNEIHHTQKKDAPSGTAITLAEQVIDALPNKTKWVNEASNDASDLVILSERIDPAPGTHTTTYTSAIDDIQITHTAHNRKGFAGGALLAAEFAATHRGVFSMKEVLGL